MSLRINHNLAAMNANRNLAGTTNALNKSMQKLSSGFRINAASDDPAGLVISEQFRAQIAGLNRAIQNSEGSITMIQTAEGALTEINNLLISMRELAIHAANEGFNDVDQLKADQAEIDNATKTIDRIAATTQFGTKKLLDGTKDNIATITTSNSSLLNIKESGLTSGQHSITATKTADSSATINTSSLGVSLANTDGDPYNLAESIHNLDVVQASDVAKKTSTAFSVKDAWGNGLTLGDTASAATLTSAAAVATVDATTAGTYAVTLNYQENGESPSGNVTVTFDVDAGEKATDIASAFQAALDADAALAGKFSVAGTAGDGHYVHVSAANAGAQYSFDVVSVSNTTGTAKAFDVTGTTNARGVSSRHLSFDVVTDQWSSGRTGIASVGGDGANDTYNTTEDLIAALNTALGTQAAGNGGFGTIADGATTNDVLASVVNTNQIQFATRDEGSDYSIKLNAGADTTTGNLRNVLGLTTDTLANSGTDALVSFDNYTSSISSVKYASTGTTTIYNKASDEAGRGSIALTVGTAVNGINLGNLLLDVKAAKFDVRLDGGPATSVTAGIEQTVFNADRSESVLMSLDLTSQGGTETINNTDQSLVFQVGPNVGQTVSIGVRGMSASSLGKNLAGNMFSSLSQIDVTTSQGAQDAQAIIDASINEVSTARGKLGSFQKNSLESNLRNLRIAAQNLTASESQIRDTDMAMEMSEFTKNQILVQAGTSMLAQANQVPQVVLSLF